jgi:hypothetical protein
MLLKRWFPLVAVGLGVLCVGACRDAAEKEKVKPPVAAECVTYVDSAQACAAKAENKAKHALDSVYSANQATIDKADTQEQMTALIEQCKKWTELLSKNPQCQRK